MFWSLAAAMKPRTALVASGAPSIPDPPEGAAADIIGRGAGVGADEHAERAESARTAVITFLTSTPRDQRSLRPDDPPASLHQRRPHRDDPPSAAIDVSRSLGRGSRLRAGGRRRDHRPPSR